MIEPIGLLTVIGLSLYLLVTVFQWWAKRNDEKARKTNEIDKEIDSASNASDILRISGKLRDKK
jgi:hypothetical protein